MDTKAIVMERLGWSKLSKKPARLVGYDADGTMVHDNLGDEIMLEITRGDGSKDFVLGRYDSISRLYRVAYDPNMKAGRILKIDNAYTCA